MQGRELTISSFPMPPDVAARREMRPTMGRALWTCRAKFFKAPPNPLQDRWNQITAGKMRGKWFCPTYLKLNILFACLCCVRGCSARRKKKYISTTSQEEGWGMFIWQNWHRVSHPPVLVCAWALISYWDPYFRLGRLLQSSGRG
jgi:hypothetical protein